MMAAYPKTAEEKQYAEKQEKDCRNLKNGLLYGKCVCAGYADILKNALSLVNIESMFISGKAGEEWHAWNKVKIDGEWYNVDVTWDAPCLRGGVPPAHCLKSDDTIKLEDKKSDFQGPKCINDVALEEILNMFTANMPELKKQPSVVDDIVQGLADLGKNAVGFFKKTYNKIISAIKKKDTPALNEPSPLPAKPKSNSWNLENYGMTKEEFDEKSKESKYRTDLPQRDEENEK